MVDLTEQEFPEAEIIIATDRYRRGKGWAMRKGFLISKGDIVCFIDGDQDLHPKMIRRLLPHLYEFDIVVGKKETKTMFSRHVLTFLSRIYTKILFGIKADTQTGVKVFKRSALPEWKTNSFAFDMEILYKAKKQGAKIFEVAVDARITSGMKLSSILLTIWESLKIKWRVK